MSRYIDAEWLKEHIEVISYEGMWHTMETDEFVAVDNINQAPSIDIVRCKECEHREEYPCKVYHDDDWYCANGERREP